MNAGRTKNIGGSAGVRAAADVFEGCQVALGALLSARWMSGFMATSCWFQ
jgi:hypothetical protein